MKHLQISTTVTRIIFINAGVTALFAWLLSEEPFHPAWHSFCYMFSLLAGIAAIADAIIGLIMLAAGVKDWALGFIISALFFLVMSQFK